MNESYYLVVKTGQAELKAIENTARGTLEKIVPIVELTRGRKKMVGEDATYPYEKKLERLKNLFGGLDIVLDLTGDESLTSPEIDWLFEFQDGYSNWVTLLQTLKSEGSFKSITPSLLQNFNDLDYEGNFSKQIKQLAADFETLFYRCSITDEYCYEDIPFILGQLPQSNSLLIMIDCGYTPQAMTANMANKLMARLDNLFGYELVDQRCTVAFCATSFPNNINDIGGLEYDVFKLAETDLYNVVRRKYNNVLYGDYGCINPVRNDTIVMARGWIPRIDVPLTDRVFYHRKRKAKSSYLDTYKIVADRVVSDSDFPASLDLWGIQEIKKCIEEPSSLAPSHWISVRMNIHIETQARRLGIIQ